MPRAPSPPSRLALAGALALCLLTLTAQAGTAPLDQAQQDWAAGETRSAVIRLKSFLKDAPDDAGARLLLGRIYLSSGDAAAAELELQRALRLGADSADALPPLIEALIAQDKQEQALALTEPDADMPASERARLLSLRGDALLRFDPDQAAARAAYEEARALAPEAIAPLLGLAQLALNAGDRQEARALVEAAAEQAPDQADPWSALGLLEYEAGHFEESAQAYGRALEVMPGRWQLHYWRGLALLDTERPQRAWEDVKALDELNREHPGRALLVGRLSLANGEPERALTLLERYLRASPDDPKAMFFAALALYQLDRPAQAEDYLERLQARYPDNAQTALLLARIRLASNDAPGAEALLRPFVGAADASLAMLETLRAALARQGLNDQAAALVERAARGYPEHVPAQLAYARQLQARGEPDAAARVLQSVVEANPDAGQARMLLVRSRLMAGDIEAARAEADAFLEAAPESPRAHMADAALRARQGDTDGARAAFQRARTLAPESDAAAVRAALALAALETSAERYDAARRVLNELLASEPGQTEAVVALAALARRESEASEGQDSGARADAAFADVLRDGLATAPDNLQLRIALASVELAAGQTDAALEVLRQAPAAQADNTRVLALRAQAELAAGHADLAKATLALLAEQQPSSAEVRYRQAAVSAADGDARTTESHLAAGLELDRRQSLAPDRLAGILGRLPGSREQEQVLAALLKIASAHPALRVVDARYALKRRDFASAIATLQTLRQANPDQRLYTMELAGALHAADRNGEAQQLLLDWIDAHPRQSPPRLLLAQTQLASQDLEGAMAQYRAVIDIAPNNPVALNNLAMLLAETAPDEARDYAERGLALRPNDPAYIDTLGTVLLALGESEQARDLLARAHANTPDPSIAFRYAKALAATGDAAGARRVLLALQARSFPERSAAEALLQQLAQAR